MKRRVLLESPYAGDPDHLVYARACMLNSILLGEAPMVSHLLYTQVLDDEVPSDRETGMDVGWAWLFAVDAVVVYMDRGESPGMTEGIRRAEAHGLPIERRWLGVTP